MTRVNFEEKLSLVKSFDSMGITTYVFEFLCPSWGIRKYC
jgi:hypothetical protein